MHFSITSVSVINLQENEPLVEFSTAVARLTTDVFLRPGRLTGDANHRAIPRGITYG